AFTVVGFKYHGKNENDEIKEMWNVFNNRIDELLAVADVGPAAYGVCGNTQADGSFDYLAGLEILSIDHLPEGMEQWTVPEQTYAIFPCTIPTIHAAYRYAFEEWLPRSGYRRAEGPDFEYYDETFDLEDADRSQLYVYIPIAR
ncbi:MAG: GyrI-like domain-containing protein, partial [Anaerolineae bacterium]